MIISASYKTDIPAFYAEWFRQRLRVGFCQMVNPYNRNQHSTISLRPGDVDGFVFWTKNLAPFFQALEDVRALGVPFVVQYTINGYPRALESRVVDAHKSVEHMRTVASRFGGRVAVWRYDTIILSSLTPASYHVENFSRLARQLAGITDEVVVSFMQLYEKTRRNLNLAAIENGFKWSEPGAAEKQALLEDLARVAVANGMRLAICSQPELLREGLAEARCIDAERLMNLGGRDFRARLRGSRKECGCFESKDIGDYNTCPHGCSYCYAVQNRELALSRYQRHDPDGAFLDTVGVAPERPPRQLPLFSKR